MWIWLPCSYYSAWHDRWLVKHFPKALCRKLSCLSRKTWMSFWGGCFFFFLSSCRHPPVTFELRGGNCIASSCLFFVEAPIPPHTLSSLEAPRAIVSFYIILFFFSKFLVAARIDSQSQRCPPAGGCLFSAPRADAASRGTSKQEERPGENGEKESSVARRWLRMEPFHVTFCLFCCVFFHARQSSVGIKSPLALP